MAGIEEERQRHYESSKETEPASPRCPKCGSYSVEVQEVNSAIIGWQFKCMDIDCEETWL